LTKNSNNKEKIIDPKQWIFVKDGLDDFRDGIPPPCEDVLIKVNFDVILKKDLIIKYLISLKAFERSSTHSKKSNLEIQRACYSYFQTLKSQSTLLFKKNSIS
jgi:hypothetical protein